MAFRFYNPNPNRHAVGDCVIRALVKLLDKDWDTIYAAVSLQGFKMKDMPSSNAVWGEYLLSQGYIPEIIPCQFNNPPCTVRSFVGAHPSGRFLLFIGGHVVTAVDGDYYDTWDSGDEVPTFYWKENY